VKIPLPSEFGPSATDRFSRAHARLVRRKQWNRDGVTAIGYCVLRTGALMAVDPIRKGVLQPADNLIGHRERRLRHCVSGNFG